MKVALASDHHGVALKARLFEELLSAGHQPTDLGPEGDGAVDYPTYAALAARMVSDGEADRAVLICGSGVGMAITANKFPGVRAVNGHDPEEAGMSRLHNDANVLALGANRVDPDAASAILSSFMTTGFEGGRHQRRVDEIGAIEREREPA